MNSTVEGGCGSWWAALIGSWWQLLVVGDSGWMGGHDWFALCGGWVVILAVNFILFTFTMSNAA